MVKSFFNWLLLILCKKTMRIIVEMIKQNLNYVQSSWVKILPHGETQLSFFNTDNLLVEIHNQKIQRNSVLPSFLRLNAIISSTCKSGYDLFLSKSCFIEHQYNFALLYFCIIDSTSTITNFISYSDIKHSNMVSSDWIINKW